MGKIISIWRKQVVGAELPLNFTVGTAPVEGSPPVKGINLLLTGAFKQDGWTGPCFCVRFEGSDVRRIIPIGEIVDVAYDTEESERKKDKVVLPALKGE